MAFIQIQSRGTRRLGATLQRRLNTFQQRQKHIFEDPLSRTLFNIKRQLKQDSKAKKRNHIYTGKMLANVKSQSKVIGIGKMEIKFGLFVPYGLKFEKGGPPRVIPLRSLNPWSQHRFGSTKPAIPIQRSIRRKGTIGYGIVERTWRNNWDYYLKIVYKRFREVWFVRASRFP